MRKHLRRIAILAPGKDLYSETFILAHKELLKGEIFFYYGGFLPKYFDNEISLSVPGFFPRVVFIIKHIFRIFPFSYPEYCLYMSFRKNKIEVAFAEYGTTGATCTKVCRFLNIPLVVHFHGYDASSKHFTAPFKDRYIEMFQYAKWIISVSKSMTKNLLALGCSPQKIIYNPYGPDDRFLKINPTFRSLNILALGRFVDKKAPYYLIMAFSKIASDIPQANLVIGGDGPLHFTCKNLVRQMNLDDRIRLPGRMDRDGFIRLLEDSVVFLQHSVTTPDGDTEGMPVAILEASAAGLPVISTRHTGISEVVLENKTGFLVDEHDVGGMSEKLSYLLSNPMIAKNMGLAGREHIKAHFTMKRHIELLQQLIDG
jgi:colanic acid/amylovoran biosynthesis glycosyltransferase